MSVEDNPAQQHSAIVSLTALHRTPACQSEFHMLQMPVKTFEMLQKADLRSKNHSQQLAQAAAMQCVQLPAINPVASHNKANIKSFCIAHGICKLSLVRSQPDTPL